MRYTHKGILRFAFGAVLMTIYIMLMAGCSSAAPAEAEPEHEEDHEHVEMSLPEVTPVNLADGEKLKVAATTNIIGDVVKNVGGDFIELTVLIGLGQNPHTYEPTAQQLAKVEDADVIFVNGLDLEEGLIKSIESIAEDAPIVPVSAGIEVIEHPGSLEQEEHEEEAGESEQEHTHRVDPHFWLDPTNVMQWTENIAEILAAADPENAASYYANAEAYLADLSDLDAYIREQTAKIPEENRKLVTDHLAFGYFVNEYGFEMIGAVIPSTTTSAEASGGELAGLVELIQTEQVPAIFVDISASERLQQLSELIAEEAGTDVKVYPLYIGSLDEAGKPGATYIGMIRYNIDQIVDGLSN